MPNYVYDGTNLPADKVDARPQPGPANQKVTADEWNKAIQALADLRLSILGGKYIGLESAPTVPVGAAGTIRLRNNVGVLEASENGGEFVAVGLGLRAEADGAVSVPAVILEAPSGEKFRVTVDNSGKLVATSTAPIDPRTNALLWLPLTGSAEGVTPEGLTFTRASSQPCATSGMTSVMLAANQPALEPDGLSFASSGITATVANPFSVGAERVYGFTLTNIPPWKQSVAAVIMQLGTFSAANSATLMVQGGVLSYREWDAAAGVRWDAPLWGRGPHHIRLRIPVSGDAELHVDGQPVTLTRTGTATARMQAMPSSIRLGALTDGSSPFFGRIRDLCLANTVDYCPTLVPGQQANTSIVTMGDSLTAGSAIAASSAVSYPRRLQYLLGYDSNYVANAGAGGNTAAQICTIWTNYVRGRGFTTLVLMTGINDINRDAQPASVPWAGIRQIVDEAKADSLTVVISTLFPFSQTWTAAKQTELEALNTLIRDYAASQSLKLVDGYALMRDPVNPTKLLPAYDSGDGLHINEAGNLYFASQIHAALS